jgi:hypothetical protein
MVLWTMATLTYPTWMMSLSSLTAEATMTKDEELKQLIYDKGLRRMLAALQYFEGMGTAFIEARKPIMEETKHTGSIATFEIDDSNVLEVTHTIIIHVPNKAFAKHMCVGENSFVIPKQCAEVIVKKDGADVYIEVVV